MIEARRKWILKILRLFVIVLVLLIIGWQQGQFFGYSFGQDEMPVESIKSPVTIEEVKQIFEKANTFSTDALGQIAVFDDKNNLLGNILSSKPYSDSLVGFAGPVHFIMGITTANKLAGIVLTEHVESPGYIRFIEKEGFFENLKQKNISDIIHQNIDAISGATLTCDAVSIALQKRLAAYMDVVLKTQKQGTKKKIGNALSILVLALALLHFFFVKIRRYRMLLLISSIAILGFFHGSFISMFLLQAWTQTGINFSSHWFLAAVVIISIILPIVFNKSFYCNYLCPYGAAQELVGRINKNRKPVPFHKSFMMKYLREAIFYTLIILVISGINIDLTNVEPFTAFIFQSASVIAIILALVFLVLSVFFNKPWCYYFCPTGQLLAFFRVSKRF